MKKFLSVALGAIVALFAVFAFAGTSSAEVVPGPVWTTKAGSEILSTYKVALNGGNTSVEAADLNLTLDEETTVTFVYSLGGGAKCVGGAPRVFLKVGQVYTNSWDQNIGDGKQCGTPIDSDPVTGKVTFTVPAGQVSHAGVVYDNGEQGTVFVSDLTIGEVKVKFNEVITASPSPTQPSTSPTVQPTTSPTSQPTTSPTVQPTSEPTDSPSATPTQSESSEPSTEPTSTSTATPTKSSLVVIPAGNDQGADLPVTGAKIGYIVGAGLLILGAGGALFVLGRRRRAENGIA